MKLVMCVWCIRLCVSILYHIVYYNQKKTSIDSMVSTHHPACFHSKGTIFIFSIISKAELLINPCADPESSICLSH